MIYQDAFLKELAAEHRRIEKLLLDLETMALSTTGETEGPTRELLGELAVLLRTHIDKEDKIFYKLLREQTVKMGQDELLPSLDTFTEAMGKVSKIAYDFIDLYSSPDSAPGRSIEEDDYCRSLAKLKAAVTVRSKSEEENLFFLYRSYYLD